MPLKGKNRSAVALGRLGGLASARARMSPAYTALRYRVSQIAAKASWGPEARAKRAANGRKRRVAEQQK